MLLVPSWRPAHELHKASRAAAPRPRSHRLCRNRAPPYLHTAPHRQEELTFGPLGLLGELAQWLKHPELHLALAVPQDKVASFQHRFVVTLADHLPPAQFKQDAEISALGPTTSGTILRTGRSDNRRHG